MVDFSKKRISPKNGFLQKVKAGRHWLSGCGGPPDGTRYFAVSNAALGVAGTDKNQGWDAALTIRNLAHHRDVDNSKLQLLWTMMPEDYILDDAYDDPVDDEIDDDALFDQPDAYEDYAGIG
jgi:hypothetical protein